MPDTFARSHVSVTPGRWASSYGRSMRDAVLQAGICVRGMASPVRALLRWERPFPYFLSLQRTQDFEISPFDPHPFMALPLLAVARIENRASHAAVDLPASRGGRFKRVVLGAAASHGGNVTHALGGRLFSSPQRNRLYEPVLRLTRSGPCLESGHGALPTTADSCAADTSAGLTRPRSADGGKNPLA
jgi:hypothetical protein